MNAKPQVVGQKKGTSDLTRPRFGPGQLLRDDDLTQGVDYTRDLSRLLFKSLLGCGVMCGLVVGSEYKCNKLNITIDSGVALDCCGDPVWVPSPQTVVIDFDCMGSDPLPLLYVLLRGCEKRCAPRTAACAGDDDETVTLCTRETACFEIQVRKGEEKPPKCVCGCPAQKDTKAELLQTECWCANPKLECLADHYAGRCGCNCADCSDCDCEWIMLARLNYNKDPKNPDWVPDHSVRRFIRPVLMRDPQAQREQYPEEKDEGGGAAGVEPAPAADEGAGEFAGAAAKGLGPLTPAAAEPVPRRRGTGGKPAPKAPPRPRKVPRVRPPGTHQG